MKSREPYYLSHLLDGVDGLLPENQGALNTPGMFRLSLRVTEDELALIGQAMRAFGGSYVGEGSPLRHMFVTYPDRVLVNVLIRHLNECVTPATFDSFQTDADSITKANRSVLVKASRNNTFQR